MSNIIDELEAEQLRQIPDFGPGDTVVVQVKVKVSRCLPGLLSSTLHLPG